ncbi:hypothetical protein MPSEU_000526000 [Mayamaea pseudoterrestris]|nr:hypothetical protein MPSEU_000526000 [Mayamaea pseudoterrestris]
MSQQPPTRDFYTLLDRTYDSLMYGLKNGTTFVGIKDKDGRKYFYENYQVGHYGNMECLRNASTDKIVTKESNILALLTHAAGEFAKSYATSDIVFEAARYGTIRQDPKLRSWVNAFFPFVDAKFELYSPMAALNQYGPEIFVAKGEEITKAFEKRQQRRSAAEISYLTDNNKEVRDTTTEGLAVGQQTLKVVNAKRKADENHQKFVTKAFERSNDNQVKQGQVLEKGFAVVQQTLDVVNAKRKADENHQKFVTKSFERSNDNQVKQGQVLENGFTKVVEFLKKAFKRSNDNQVKQGQMLERLLERDDHEANVRVSELQASASFTKFMRSNAFTNDSRHKILCALDSSGKVKKLTKEDYAEQIAARLKDLGVTEKNLTELQNRIGHPGNATNFASQIIQLIKNKQRRAP